MLPEITYLKSLISQSYDNVRMIDLSEVSPRDRADIERHLDTLRQLRFVVESLSPDATEQEQRVALFHLQLINGGHPIPQPPPPQPKTSESHMAELRRKLQAVKSKKA
jgi:hypothetical protein